MYMYMYTAHILKAVFLNYAFSSNVVQFLSFSVSVSISTVLFFLLSVCVSVCVCLCVCVYVFR